MKIVKDSCVLYEQLNKSLEDTKMKEGLRLTKRYWKYIIDGLTLAINHQEPTENFKNKLYELRFFIEQKLKISSRPSHNNDLKKDCFDCKHYPNNCKNYKLRGFYACSELEHNPIIKS